jgi:tetraacyldisaccharide 4'-kinase
MADEGGGLSASFDQLAREVMSGQRRGAGATVLRGLLRMAEPMYGSAMLVRNRLFDWSIRTVYRLPRPVISVGNITTGGTGKTPLVIRLTRQLQDLHGLRPAILLRGYTVGSSQRSDEQMVLQHALNAQLVTGPDRIASAQRALAADAGIDLFILDDAFQHRRVARDLDIVLIDATNPFGFGHVLPRGLLREPLSGLGRAEALIVTHGDEVSSLALDAIRHKLRQHNRSASIYSAVHDHSQFEDLSGVEVIPREALRGRRYFAFCGIGNPASFRRQLAAIGGTEVGQRWFGDHHDYVQAELDDLARAAAALDAEVLVTTAKDGVKLASLDRDNLPLPIWQAMLEVRFLEQDESRLLEQVVAAVERHQRAG